MASITTYENLPINKLIEQLKNIKGHDITFDELKEELTNGKYHLSLKDDDNLCMIYYNFVTSDEKKDDFVINLERSCRSIVLEKQTLKPLVTQYNKILYNDDTIEFLKDKEWKNVCVQKCYEGTLLLLFNYNDTWYITTRRCLDSKNSMWIRNNSYYEMFIDVMNDKFTFEDLNKDYCYHFVLVHHKNKNIVNYNWLGKDYKELFHIMTTEKYTLFEVECKINDKVKYIQEETFDSLNDLISELNAQDELDKKYQKITNEGYVLKYYHGEKGKSPFTTLKLQTNIYETLMKLKPNNSNIYQCFLELYQKDKLNEFMPYFTKFGGDVVKRIHVSMQTLSRELLDLYHITRNKKNVELYNELTNSYKKCLYKLHGLYIKNRSQDFENGVDKSGLNDSIKSINVFDIYKYLKNLPANELRQIYYDRINSLENPLYVFLNKKCINTMSQSTLMFKNNKP